MYELKGRAKLAFLIAGQQKAGVVNIHMTGTSKGWSGYLHLKDHHGNDFDPVLLADNVPEEAIEQLCFVLDPGTYVNSKPVEGLDGPFDEEKDKRSPIELIHGSKLI